MSDASPLPFKVVDGLELSEDHRQALRPGEALIDGTDRERRLPRFFYEIDSWDAAMKTQLAPNFSLWEFVNIDLQEAEILRRFPRYVPCAVTLLAVHLELFRSHVGKVVHIAANGGYRSPAHALSKKASTHCWASAANIYRIGDDYLDSREKIERYNALATATLPSIWPRPFGHSAGYADDHVHLDLGYVVLVPGNAAGDC